MGPNPLARTYEIRGDAPAAMSWEEYAQRVRDEWAALLSGQPTESQIQAFLEMHPALVPGAHSALGRMRSGHGPFPSALITQPALRGFETRPPDFAWISGDSAFLNPIFVEIEAPGKRWLTAKGQQHHQLTQALHQLDEWREWFDQPVNRQLFYEAYGVPNMLRRRKWEPIWLLIYGRRKENPERVNKLRARLTSATRIVIPYEHIEPDPDASDYICARRGSDGYHAVSVPATVQLGPSHAEHWALIAGKERAVDSTPWISDERRAFLIERFPYWDQWGRHGRGVRALSDVE